MTELETTESWLVHPGRSIGPLLLGMAEAEVLAKLGPPKKMTRGDLLGYDFGEIVVIFNKNLEVDSVVASEGFKGRTADGIRVGMSFKDLLEVAGQVTWDVDMYMWRPSRDGLWLEIKRPAPRGPLPPQPEMYVVMHPDTAYVTELQVGSIGSEP